MKRRDFIAASCLAGLAPLGKAAMAADANADTNKEKEYYELRLYKIASAEKRTAIDEFFAKAAIPAWNRAGIKPVGVFEFIKEEDKEEVFDLYVLLPHKTLDSVATATAKLLADDAYLKAGADVLGAPKADPAYERIESTLMVAFDGIPVLEVPSKKDTRIFQLRTYEAHSVERGQRKIEMFNDGGELPLFRSTGMPPVFFGETLVGTKVPNLTYMLGFDDEEAKKKGWAAFFAHPEWDKLKKNPRYKDTVSRITNIMLRPAACSQI